MTVRPRVLFLTQRLPYAPNRGDRIRAYHLLVAMKTFADVRVVALTHDSAEAEKAGALSGIADGVWTAPVPRVRNRLRAVAALAGRTPLTHVLLDSPHLSAAVDEACRGARPDVVYAYCSGIAPVALRPPLTDVPLVADLVDIDSQKWRDLAKDAAPWLAAIYRREARVLGAFEEALILKAKSAFVVSERERLAMTSAEAAGRLTVLPNGIDTDGFRPPAGVPRRDGAVVFTGVFDYAPNEAGAMWLVESVWPVVRQRVPHATLTLAGANPTQRLRAAARQDVSVTVTGTVPDIRPFLWGASLAAAPLHVARGLQNKVLEALAAGLPCVVTPQVMDGLPASSRAGCVSATDVDEFAEHLIELLTEGAQARQRRVEAADIDSLRWDTVLRPLRDHIERARH